MSFPPFDFDASDSLYLPRTTLTILGLLAVIAAFTEFIYLLARYRRDVFTIATNAAALLACAVLGWRSYPYWTNGVYRMRSGAFRFHLQDPKDLAPMIWIGDFWRIPVLLLYLVCYVAIPALLILSVIAFRRRMRVAATVIALCATTALMFMIGFSPKYVDWILD